MMYVGSLAISGKLVISGSTHSTTSSVIMKDTYDHSSCTSAHARHGLIVLLRSMIPRVQY
jgi:hypothetical protein